ncbi:DUF389 domain-containing protein [Haladaptatus pallidirubidus]|uniref:TIGR00341 family protein n=1 Tax=Haladaptatus pallidirubidus TaxID=1008152 RepID=A0AAV3URN6_9EURY|nr:DUF389 domain-containing protein [Haladaptatus pallidirubidus]
MREIHIHVSEDERGDIVSILDEYDVNYTVISDDEGGAIYFFPIPSAMVGSMLDEFRSVEIHEEAYTVSTKAEFVETPDFVKLSEKYSDHIQQLAKSELHAKIREMQWPYQLYYLGTLLSVIAAAAGLLLDQPALIIGSMIVAPQVSSALAAPTGIILGDWDLFVDSVKEQGLGLGAAVIAAAVFGWFVRWTGIVPPGLSVMSIELIGVRLAPTALSTIGAIIAGIVGAFGYTTEQSTTIIGVMIAAAIIPAAAATGLAIAWMAPLFGVGAGLLLLVNILAINIGALATLVVMGYRPRWLGSDSSLKNSIPSGRHVVTYGTIIVLVLASLGTGYLTAMNIMYSQTANQEVEAMLNQPAYSNLTLTGVQTAYGGPVLTSTAANVTVTVSRTSNTAYSNLPNTLERQIERRTGRNVYVTVEFTESGTANRVDSTDTSDVNRWVSSRDFFGCSYVM